jgi:hypothetical protein
MMRFLAIAVAGPPKSALPDSRSLKNTIPGGAFWPIFRDI